MRDPAAASDITLCVLERWRPGIGDPSLMGWLTVAAYFLAAGLALMVTLRAGRLPRETRRRERLFWALVFLAMAGLGVNKQLDLQSMLTGIGRCLALRGGWYDDRRSVQTAVILALVAATTVAALATAIHLRETLSRHGLALLGVACVATFVLVRAVGFHHLDALISMRVGGWRMNWILELGGIALVALGAIRVLLIVRRPPDGAGKDGATAVR